MQQRSPVLKQWWGPHHILVVGDSPVRFLAEHFGVGRSVPIHPKHSPKIIKATMSIPRVLPISEVRGNRRGSKGVRRFCEVKSASYYEALRKEERYGVGSRKREGQRKGRCFSVEQNVGLPNTTHMFYI